ncbi:MAG: diacylglycerol kinase family lipid kinase [Odoribacteraceae bacterium]|jgi:YegS/Rv2252/BmrU family lipid kinase|nr:diacylglycerol kinase family lipid kinase [Odoribacteraceae bacterium]
MTPDDLFIVNPTAGAGNGKHFPRLLARHYNRPFTARFTDRPGHAAELAAGAAREGFARVVAVGGDGTLNEVGGALVGTGVVMGIIPTGSGNGLARHLGVSTRVKKALRQLRDGKIVPLDVIDINGKYSLNVSGVGLDAEVAHRFARVSSRGFISYARAAALLWFRYPGRRYTFRSGETRWEEHCLIASLANSSRYGYNISIAPGASTNDGLMDLCIIRRPPLHLLPLYLFRAMTRSLANSPYFRVSRHEEITIEGNFSAGHLDGNPCAFSSPLRARVIPGALRVIVP